MGLAQVLQALSNVALDKKPSVVKGGIFGRPGWMRWSWWGRSVGRRGRTGTAEHQTHPAFPILCQALPIGIHEETNLLLNPFASSQQLHGDPALTVTTSHGVWALGKGVFPGYWLLLPLGAGGRGAGVCLSLCNTEVGFKTLFPSRGATNPKNYRIKV